MRYIASIDRRGVLLDDGTLIPVGCSYYERLHERLAWARGFSRPTTP